MKKNYVKPFTTMIMLTSFFANTMFAKEELETQSGIKMVALVENDDVENHEVDVIEETKEKKVEEVVEVKKHTKLSYKQAINMNLTETSGITKEQLEKILKGTQLENLGETFIKAEQENGVNALYLVAHAALESGWGKSKIAREKNNIYGFRAYDGRTHMATKFSSKEECILYVSKYIKENYLAENGKYYNGLTLKDVNKKYASDQNWHKKIADIMTRF